MENIDSFFQELYRNFNARNIELVISKMTDDVKWANGMEGGYVYGHGGVKDYWTRQFLIINSNVTPLEIVQDGDVVKVKVHQVVHDLKGTLLADEFVYHHFRLQGNRISGFEISK